MLNTVGFSLEFIIFLAWFTPTFLGHFISYWDVKYYLWDQVKYFHVTNVKFFSDSVQEPTEFESCNKDCTMWQKFVQETGQSWVCGTSKLRFNRSSALHLRVILRLANKSKLDWVQSPKRKIFKHISQYMTLQTNDKITKFGLDLPILPLKQEILVGILHF